jgi:hypothetical protein
MFKLRCRVKGIIITNKPKNFNVVWKRPFNPEIFPEDRKQFKEIIL